MLGFFAQVCAEAASPCGIRSVRGGLEWLWSQRPLTDQAQLSFYIFTVSLAVPTIKGDNVSMQAHGSTQFSLKEMENDSRRPSIKVTSHTARTRGQFSTLSPRELCG